jgi:hypothetical protein
VFGPFPSTNASIVLILDMPGLYTYRVVLFNEQGWAHRSSTPQCLTILPNWRLHSMLDRSVSGFNLRAIARLRSLAWKCVLCSSAERPVGALGPIDSLLHRGMFRYLMTMDATNPGDPAFGALWSSLAVGFLRMEDLTSAANAVEQVFPAPIRSIAPMAFGLGMPAHSVRRAGGSAFAVPDAKLALLVCEVRVLPPVARASCDPGGRVHLPLQMHGHGNLVGIPQWQVGPVRSLVGNPVDSPRRSCALVASGS